MTLQWCWPTLTGTCHPEPVRAFCEQCEGSALSSRLPRPAREPLVHFPERCEPARLLAGDLLFPGRANLAPHRNPSPPPSLALPLDQRFPFDQRSDDAMRRRHPELRGTCFSLFLSRPHVVSTPTRPARAPLLFRRPYQTRNPLHRPSRLDRRSPPKISQRRQLRLRRPLHHQNRNRNLSGLE